MKSNELDDTMQALADRTRRAILLRLSRGEARVTEIATPFSMSLNAVSKHIHILERAQLVRRRRQGREHFLSVNPVPLAHAAKWIDGYRKMWEEKLDKLGEYLSTLQKQEKQQEKHHGT